MKYGINKATLVGVIGEQPKLIESDNDYYITFPLITPETYKDKNGDEVTKKQWHKCIARKDKANVLKEYANKGDSLYIEGRIEYRLFNDNIVTFIEIDNFLFLKPKKPKSDEQTI